MIAIQRSPCITGASSSAPATALSSKFAAWSTRCVARSKCRMRWSSATPACRRSAGSHRHSSRRRRRGERRRPHGRRRQHRGALGSHRRAGHNLSVSRLIGRSKGGSILPSPHRGAALSERRRAACPGSRRISRLGASRRTKEGCLWRVAETKAWCNARRLFVSLMYISSLMLL